MQHKEVNAALVAIRAISTLYPDDVANIIATLSCQVANCNNKHLKLNQVAVDSLDNLANHLFDEISFNEVEA